MCLMVDLPMIFLPPLMIGLRDYPVLLLDVYLTTCCYDIGIAISCGKRKSSGTVCPSPVSLFVVWLWSHSFVKADHAALLLRAIRRSIIAFRI